MKLQKIISRFQKLHPKEIDLSLDRIKNICQKLGNPQDKIKAISIVGTNGKQSTINAIFAILNEAKIKLKLKEFARGFSKVVILRSKNTGNW